MKTITIKTNELISTTIHSCIVEIEMKYKNEITIISDALNIATCDVAEMVATHIIMNDTDYIISECSLCGMFIANDDIDYDTSNNAICELCAQKYERCDICKKLIDENVEELVHIHNRNQRIIETRCDYCADSSDDIDICHESSCREPKKVYLKSEMFKNNEGELICLKCDDQ